MYHYNYSHSFPSYDHSNLGTFLENDKVSLSLQVKQLTVVVTFYFFNVSTRKFKMTYAVLIVSLLDSTGPERGFQKSSVDKTHLLNLLTPPVLQQALLLDEACDSAFLPSSWERMLICDHI